MEIYKRLIKLSILLLFLVTISSHAVITKAMLSKKPKTLFVVREQQGIIYWKNQVETQIKYIAPEVIIQQRNDGFYSFFLSIFVNTDDLKNIPAMALEITSQQSWKEILSLLSSKLISTLTPVRPKTKKIYSGTQPRYVIYVPQNQSKAVFYVIHTEIERLLPLDLFFPDIPERQGPIESYRHYNPFYSRDFFGQDDKERE